MPKVTQNMGMECNPGEAPGLWAVQPHFIPRKSLPIAKPFLVHLSLTPCLTPDLRHHRRAEIMNPRMQKKKLRPRNGQDLDPRPPDFQSRVRRRVGGWVCT